MSTNKEFVSDGTEVPPSSKILIMGAGLGGISCAIALKTRLGCEDFIIYEKASDVGGTWRLNTYPGCSSDVPIHFYSLSTELDPSWRASHGSQQEILEYWRRLVDKHALRPHMRFGHNIISAEWDSRAQQYHVTLDVTVDGQVKRMETTACAIVSAVGLLDIPRWPAEAELKGVTSGGFKGAIWHSAQWDHSTELKGKRVAVIGLGSSASQFIPIISEDPTVQVANFIRTPPWFIVPPRFDYSERQKWIFKHIPFAMQVYRSRIMFLQDCFYSMWRFEYIRSLIRARLIKHLLDNAPAEYYDKLIPDYPPGCKRLIVDSGYVSALHRPNVSLNFDGIEEIVEDGVVTKKGEHIPFDVIILATGYVTDQYPLSVRGSEGHTIQEYYDSQEGPTAYLGTAVPGFPNFFILGGPNTATGHSSVIFTEEVQINYILKFLAPLLARTVLSFSVTHIAADAYNTIIQARLTSSTSVFTQCASWYRTGRSATGKIVSIFPGPVVLFWWYLRRVRWADWRCVVPAGEDREEISAQKWVRRRRARKVGVWGVFGVLGVALWWLMSGRQGGAEVREAVKRLLIIIGSWIRGAHSN